MSLEHEFYLVPANIEVNSWEKWRSLNKDTWKDKVCIDYDFICSIETYLNWIPSFDPNSDKERKGLDRYGITLFKEKNFDLLINVLDSLISLFSVAPQKFTIKGDTIWKIDENGSDDDGYWEAIQVEVFKNEIITKLTKLKRFADIAKNDNFNIFHYGI